MRPPLFVELCAGTAALSLRLAHPRARPPVSRMGAKTGYADVILRCMGLRPGQGADRYLWCEPDAGVRLLLHAYRDRELATAAADIIRGWADEEPRALWERLRAEGPAVCPPVDAREVARWQVVVGSMWVHKQDGRPLSGWAWCDDKPKPPEHAERLATLATLPATIADDARKVDPPAPSSWFLRQNRSPSSSQTDGTRSRLAASGEAKSAPLVNSRPNGSPLVGRPPGARRCRSASSDGDARRARRDRAAACHRLATIDPTDPTVEAVVVG